MVVFEQNTFPCLEFDGKIILSDRNHLARAPDGNGGLYAALANPRTKVIADMRSRGIKYIHVYCVDNILVKMADPVFVGFCTDKGVECGAKVCQVGFSASPDTHLEYPLPYFVTISIVLATLRHFHFSLSNR